MKSEWTGARFTKAQPSEDLMVLGAQTAHSNQRDPYADEFDEFDDPDDEPEPPLRCSPTGIARCGTCHNGQSHGNGTKPAALPNVLAADDPFTCRRCHPTGRWR